MSDSPSKKSRFTHGAAEEVLRRECEQAQRYLDLANVIFLAIDSEGVVTLANRKACEILCCPENEIVGHNWFDEFIPPAAREEIKAVFKSLMRGQVEAIEYHENRVLRGDGEERIIAWHNTLLKDGDGRTTGTLSAGTDVTEQKRVAEKLKAETRAIEASVDGIAILGGDEKYVFLNQAHARIYGYGSAKELLGKTWRTLYKEDELRRFEREIIPVLRREGFWRGEAVGKKKDGSTFPQEVSLTALEEGMICVVRDITVRRQSEKERLELERRLLHSQKLESLGVMAGGIAHDFNNLLMAILGNLDMALLDLSPVSSSRHSIEQAVRAAKRAGDLTRQMLAYSGKGKFVVRDIDLSELVRENVHILQATVPKNTTLRLDLDPDLPTITADAGQIQQIVMNLITNASEAVENSPGVVVISTRFEKVDRERLRRSFLEEKPEPGRFVVLEVTDTGCGMSPETLSHIFEPFFTSKLQGRGLGLSAVLGIVRGHKGAILIDSEEGKGSTISVLFPVAESPSVAAKGKSPRKRRAPDSLAKAAASGQILVVDDEEMVRNLCRRMVERLGFQVLTAEEGEEAVRVFRENAEKIVCVILDLSMPRMDGLAALEEMRAVDPDVRVILSSGYNRQSVTRLYTARGLAGFLQKPYKFESLQEELERVLHR